MSTKSGLGRGLGSLIPENFDTGVLIEKGERIEQLRIADVAPNPDQPRTVFDQAALQELAGSIKRYGILQPLVVSPHGKQYVIIAGERRWRASQLAGLNTVPAVVRSSKDLERLELALVENVQRVDLSPLEQAVSIERLHQQFNLNYNAIAQRLGKSVAAVSNAVRLLQLPDESKRALSDGVISEGHARQILALKDKPTQQAALLALITKNGWSVRQAERYVNSVKDGHTETKSAQKRMANETPETKQLSKRYGTQVRIHRMAKGGRIELAFTTDEELTKLLEALDS